MSKKALVILAPGFEETELVATVDMLRRGGIKTTIAGFQKGPVQGSRDIFIVAEETLDHAMAHHATTPFDALVLPGGLGGVNAILNHPPLLQFVRQLHGEGRVLGAICAAPLILEKCGVLEHLTAFTSHPSCTDFPPERMARYSQKRVVVSGSVITSRAPGTACSFGLALVRLLKGEKTMLAVNKGVLDLHGEKA